MLWWSRKWWITWIHHSPCTIYLNAYLNLILFFFSSNLFFHIINRLRTMQVYYFIRLTRIEKIIAKRFSEGAAVMDSPTYSMDPRAQGLEHCWPIYRTSQHAAAVRLLQLWITVSHQACRPWLRTGRGSFRWENFILTFSHLSFKLWWSYKNFLRWKTESLNSDFSVKRRPVSMRKCNIFYG